MLNSFHFLTTCAFGKNSWPSCWGSQAAGRAPGSSVECPTQEMKMTWSVKLRV